jgi:hypothetical protein
LGNIGATWGNRKEPREREQPERKPPEREQPERKPPERKQEPAERKQEPAPAERKQEREPRERLWKTRGEWPLLPATIQLESEEEVSRWWTTWWGCW